MNKLCIVVAFCLIALVYCKDELEGSKPHVVMFLIDDMGYNDIFWNNDEIKMPFTQSLAESGKILNNAYSAPVCSPSRGTLMSGLYAHKIGMSHAVYSGAKSECLKTDVKLLPEKLKAVGYKTHMLGKWHLGFCGAMCTPIGRGFDTFYGFYHGQVDHYTRVSSAEQGLKIAYDWHDTRADNPKSWGTSDLGDAKNKNLYSNDLITDRAVKILEEADADEPMFLYYSSPLVHTPMQVPKRYWDDVPKDAGGGSWKRRTFIGMAKSLDDSIKTVVETLKKKKMYDNTVIIFHSDNGGEAHYGSNIPLRGAKASLYEGGIRVPSFIHSKLLAKSEQGKTSQGMFFIADWHSTIMELAGIKLEKLDAVPQLDFLFYGKDSKRTEFIPSLDVYSPQLFGKGAIRSGDYKLITGWPGLFDGYEGNDTLTLPYIYDFWGLNKGITNGKRGGHGFDFGAILRYLKECSGLVQMYNIKDDPAEKNDISSSEPAVRDDLLKKLKEASLDFYQFNRVSNKEVKAGLPQNNNKAWVSGWCPDGPLSCN